MPIVIDEQSNNVQTVDIKGKAKASITNATPKFFNQVLTGKGGTSRGLLNENRDPKMYKDGYAPIDVDLEMRTYHNNGLKIYDIPCNIIHPQMWNGVVNTLDITDIGKEAVKIAEKNGTSIYITVPLAGIQVEEDRDIDPVTGTPKAGSADSRCLNALMRMFLFMVKDPNSNTANVLLNGLSSAIAKSETQKTNGFWTQTTSNLIKTLRDVASSLAAQNYDVDKQALEDFLRDYSLYRELSKAADRWITKADYYIADVMISESMQRMNENNKNISNACGLGNLSLKHYMKVNIATLEKYDVSLDTYYAMYNKMSTIMAGEPKFLTELCKMNLNLMLSDTLTSMNKKRASLPACPCNVHITSRIPYSNEQRNAIESPSPLTLVQSGAGTGKSTVILGRIDHMIANGIKPEDITVLSFTNAAADHITALKPSVHSMTTASMLHTIYSYNFPTHVLSSLATIINSLGIFYDRKSITPQQSDFIDHLRYRLERLMLNNEYTAANNFVEDHLDETIDVLNTIGQTSLELESIICYQKIDTLQEPPEVQTKHLIIDEVQDNSIAEFIYSIKYTELRQCSMYIVGDCSQTLYEFRSSNPKALNVLEKSGVYQTYKLQTNYRSNQEILDFANVVLDTITANQYANIRLRANSLKPVTKQSFTDAVNFIYHQMLKKSPQAYQDMYDHSIAVDTRPYIQDKLAKGEQICILAHARRTLSEIQKRLEKAYPCKKIVSIIPQRQRDNAMFSKFIAKCWDLMSYTPPASLVDILRQEMLANAVSLATRGQRIDDIKTNIRFIIDDFEAKHGAMIHAWEKSVQSSQMTTKQMLELLKKQMIDFEIKRNSLASAVRSAKNSDAKNSSDVENADFILSTIHSAKGLEFDNVIVYYAAGVSVASMDEADKRMYYVAFTRAKKSELIYAYDTMAYPKIEADYESIVDKLDKLDAKIKAGQVIVDTDIEPDSNTNDTDSDVTSKDQQPA